MSKRKGKAAPKKAPKKKASRRPMQEAAGLAATGGKTVNATIFVYRTSNGNKIRTSPQRIYANPEDQIEWTVVNLVDGSDVPATITWPGEGPWGKEPIEVQGCKCKELGGAPAGRFKYTVSALNAQEDPEIEIPDV